MRVIHIHIFIRHVPSGTMCVTWAIESSSHSLSSTSFQPQPQPEFYEFPGGVGSSRWRWELQPLPLEFLQGGYPRFVVETASPPPPPGLQKSNFFRSAAASCALVRQPWRQDVHTSPEIAKKTPSWSQSLPIYLPKPSQGSLQEPPEEAPTPKIVAKVL